MYTVSGRAWHARAIPKRKLIASLAGVHNEHHTYQPKHGVMLEGEGQKRGREGRRAKRAQTKKKPSPSTPQRMATKGKKSNKKNKNEPTEEELFALFLDDDTDDFTAKFKAVLQEIFQRFDKDGDGAWNDEV